MPISDELRQRLAVVLEVNWEALESAMREAVCPQPPYKEPLAYLLYLVPEIPWRQCGKLATRLRQLGPSPLSEEALHLAEDLDRAWITHRPYTLVGKPAPESR